MAAVPVQQAQAMVHRVASSGSSRTFVAKALETFGLTLTSALIFYALMRYLNKALSADNMIFLLNKKEKKKFKLSDHWAGLLPQQAQEVLDIFNYPDVYEHFGTQLPRGYECSEHFYRSLLL